MKKTIFTIFLLQLVITVSSQEFHQFYNHLFYRGYYIGVNGGTNLYVAEGNDFSHRSALSFSQNGGSMGRVEVGYDYTSVIGVRGFVGIAQHNWPDIRFQNTDKTTRVVSFGSQDISADLMVNVSNLLFGYKNNRFVDISAFGGVGMAHRNKADFTTDHISPFGRVGIQGDFPILKQLDLTMIAETNVLDDNFNEFVTGVPFDFNMAFTVGVKYRLRR